MKLFYGVALLEKGTDNVCFGAHGLFVSKEEFYGLMILRALEKHPGYKLSGISADEIEPSVILQAAANLTPKAE